MMQQPTSQDEILAKIAQQSSQSSRGRLRWLLFISLFLVGAYFLFADSGSTDSKQHYLFTELFRGKLTVTVTATGSLQPTNQVDVSSEVSGLVKSVLVEENEFVNTGQVLASLDTAKLENLVLNAQASLASSKARVLQAQATVREAQAKLQRLQAVASVAATSKADLEAAEAVLARAKAEESMAHAGVEQAQVALSSARIDLEKTTIRSPINGIVLSREVEPGQTVAASLTAPVLFTLAEDLAQMELQISVDEADVGQVQTGEAATFNVDAYRDRKYPSVVSRVNYGSQTEDGVVSYKTLLTVDNQDLSLRPGMTATAEITTLERVDALLVQSAALRFSPAPAETEEEESGSVISRLLPRPPQAARKVAVTSQEEKGKHQLWVLRDGKPVAVPVQVGATNGKWTEVLSDELSAGTQVILQEGV